MILFLGGLKYGDQWEVTVDDSPVMVLHLTSIFKSIWNSLQVDWQYILLSNFGYNRNLFVASQIFKFVFNILKI